MKRRLEYESLAQLEDDAHLDKMHKKCSTTFKNMLAMVKDFQGLNEHLTWFEEIGRPVSYSFDADPTMVRIKVKQDAPLLTQHGVAYVTILCQEDRVRPGETVFEVGMCGAYGNLLMGRSAHTHVGEFEYFTDVASMVVWLDRLARDHLGINTYDLCVDKRDNANWLMQRAQQRGVNLLLYEPITLTFLERNIWLKVKQEAPLHADQGVVYVSIQCWDKDRNGNPVFDVSVHGKDGSALEWSSRNFHKQIGKFSDFRDVASMLTWLDQLANDELGYGT